MRRGKGLGAPPTRAQRTAQMYNHMNYRLAAWQGGMTPWLPYQSKRTAELNGKLAAVVAKLRHSIKQDYKSIQQARKKGNKLI